MQIGLHRLTLAWRNGGFVELGSRAGADVLARIAWVCTGWTAGELDSPFQISDPRGESLGQ